MICEQTGKFCYEDRSVAMKVLTRSKKKHKSRRIKANKSEPKEIGVYRCEFCHKFHLHGVFK